VDSTTSRERAPVRIPVRADSRFMRVRLSRWIAMGFGSGLSPFAPGTVGTLWAWLAFAVLERWIPPIGWAVLVVGGFALGIWACSRTSRDLGVPDHGAIVWDEIVAFWLVLLFVPAGFGDRLGAFVVFRFFDIVKPPPIRHFERTLKDGLGIMFDDVLAAAYTLLLFALWYR
jgi:phosphatidylglycerophosphatase A